MRLARILCFAAILVGGSVLPAHASTISLSVTPPVYVGSTFDVDVLVYNAFDGLSDPFLVGYGFEVFVGNSALIQYQGATVGPLFIGMPSPSFAITVAPGGLTAADLSGPLHLATLHFLALSTGPATISIVGIGTDFQGLVYSSTFQDIRGTVSVSATPAAVPEPGSLVLLISGLPIMLWIGRRARML
jgi:hypothetical protein